MEDVLKKLSRWYDIEFFIEDDSLSELRFTGDLPKYDDLNDVLHKLQQTTYIRFVQDGRTVNVCPDK